MSQNDETAQELIKDQCILIDLQKEQIEELLSENRVLKAQVQALMKGQKVDYDVA